LQYSRGNGKTTNEFCGAIYLFKRWDITGDGKTVTTTKLKEDMGWKNNMYCIMGSFWCRGVGKDKYRKGG